MSVATLARVIPQASRKAAGSGFMNWLKSAFDYGIRGGDKTANLAQALGIRVLPDAIGGVMIGASTPGDLGDKIIAGTTDAALGIVGGVGLSGALKGVTRGSNLGAIATDMVGSYAGFNAAMPVSDALLRGKDKLSGGEGKSPYDKLDEQRRKEIEMNLLAQLGLM